MAPLSLLKFDSRARITSWGMAFCTMFIVASFSIAAGLDSSMQALTDNFSSELYLVTLPGSEGPEEFPEVQISRTADMAAYGSFCRVRVNSSDEVFTFFAFSDPHRLLDESFEVEGTDVLVGSLVPLSGEVGLISEPQVNVSVVGRFSSAVFSANWVLASSEVLASLLGSAQGKWNFCILESPTRNQIQALAADGFSVQQMIGIVEFLESGSAELRSDALWVLAPSGLVIAVLAYGFIGSMVADRRHEIGILKTLGARRRVILWQICAHALVISAWGALIGLALGVVLSYGFSTMASTAFTSVFLVETDEVLLLVSFCVTVVAGMLGGLLPALRMSLSSPVKDLKEVAPFS